MYRKPAEYLLTNRPHGILYTVVSSDYPGEYGSIKTGSRKDFAPNTTWQDWFTSSFSRTCTKPFQEKDR